jgi:hypothetical protein
MGEGLHEPLARRHDLEGTVTLLEELDGVGDGSGLAHQVAGGGEEFDDAGLGLLDGPAGELGVGGGGGGRVVRLPALGAEGHRQEPAVAPDDAAGRQLQLAPPGHVGGVAERADHGDPGALLGVGQLVGDHRDPHAEQRTGHRRAEQRSVPLVVGVGDEGHAGREEFGPGGLDLHRTLCADPGEPQPVVRAGPVAVLELGLAHRGAEVDVPEGGRGALDDLPALGQPEEPPLGHPAGPLADGGVGVRPVDGQAERAPQVLEDLLVLEGQLVAERHEIRTGDGHRILRWVGGGHEVGVVGEPRVAPDAEVVLHPAFGRQAVVVPAHRVEDLPTAHPLEAGHRVGVGVGEHVADVQ